MIKLFSTIAASAAIIAAGTAASAAVGDVVGNVYSTDILATVNGEPIPSYALDGKTAIALRDLEHYGFSIYYSESSRLAQANLDMHSIEEYTPIEGVERGTVGEITGNIYESDITAYINGESVSSYNIGGRLVVVIEDIAPHDDGSEFSQYGYAKTGLTYVWDAENRRIDLITLPEDNQYESTYKAMSNRLTLSIDGDRLVVTKDRIADKYISPGSYRGIAGYSVVGNQIFPIKYTYNDGHEEDIGLLYGFYGIMTDETGAVIGRTDTMNNTGIHIDQAKLNAIIAENYVEPLTFDEEIEFWRNGGTSMWRVTAEIYTDNYVILDMMMSGLPHGGAAYSTIRIDRDPIETTEIMTDNISDPELYSDTEPDILYYFRGSYLYKRNVLTGAEEEVCAATTENVLNYLKEHWETVYEKSADGITSLLMRRGDDYRVYTISPNGLKVIRGPIDEAYFYNNNIFVRYNGEWRFELYNELPDEYTELVETEGERIDTAS